MVTVVYEQISYRRHYSSCWIVKLFMVFTSLLPSFEKPHGSLSMEAVFLTRIRHKMHISITMLQFAVAIVADELL